MSGEKRSRVEMSFVDTAGSDFTLQNLPYGVFSTQGGSKRCGSAIGSYVVDLAAAATAGLIPNTYAAVFSQETLNEFMGMGSAAWDEVRSALTKILSADCDDLQNNAQKDSILIPMADTEMHLPARIGDYTDFYASKEHAFNIGCLFRGKDNALQPNWKRLPVGYHGRASSVVVSGYDFPRPKGQVLPRDKTAAEDTVYRQSMVLDYELEMGIFVGPGNKMGESIDVNNASDNIFGLVLLNDWSARDVQKFEYVPLGPFNGKNFCTTISPWIVTSAALKPFTTEAPVQDPPVLDYLTENNRTSYDIKLSIGITLNGTTKEVVTCKSNYSKLYWTAEQMLAHHSSTGCPMNPGDLLGTGTISTEEGEDMGMASLLERTSAGKKELDMGDGNVRKFLQDGDRVSIRGFCESSNGERIGFGECTGCVLPALK